MPQIREHGEIETVVRSHAGWVHACACRRVTDEAMAEDVTQAVFILFWRKRGRLGKEVKVAGWLYWAVRYCAARALRDKDIRERHEREAAMAGLRDEVAGEAEWTEVSPELEAAVDRLGERYREAVLLRFYRQMSFVEVGQAMGISEKAAQKRVERAVEKLREVLGKKGVRGTTAGLSAVLVGNVVGQMPEHLVERIVLAAGSGGGNAVAAGIAKGAMKMMTMAKVKVAAAVVMLGAAVGVGIAAQEQSAARPRPVAATGATVAVNPETRKLAAKIADEIEANMAKTTGIGYTFRTDHGLPEDADIAAKKIGRPRQDAVSETGEYSFDVASGRQYLLRTTWADKPAEREDTEVGGIPGRWTVLRSEAPGATSRWARVTSDPPSELRDEFRIGYCLIGTSSLPEVIRAARDIEISRDALDGEDCYRIAMFSHQGVRAMRDGKEGVFGADVPLCIWLSIKHGLLPIRIEDYDVYPPPEQWNVAALVRPERLFSVRLQLDLRQMDNGMWLPSRTVSYTFLRDVRWGKLVAYDNLAVNDAVTVKTVTIPAAAWKGVLKDMLRK